MPKSFRAWRVAFSVEGIIIMDVDNLLGGYVLSHLGELRLGAAGDVQSPARPANPQGRQGDAAEPVRADVREARVLMSSWNKPLPRPITNYATRLA